MTHGCAASGCVVLQAIRYGIMITLSISAPRYECRFQKEGFAALRMLGWTVTPHPELFLPFWTNSTQTVMSITWKCKRYACLKDLLIKVDWIIEERFFWPYWLHSEIWNESWYMLSNHYSFKQKQKYNTFIKHVRGIASPEQSITYKDGFLNWMKPFSNYFS